MRILLATDYFPGYGSNVLFEIGKRWANQGHQVFVLCSRFSPDGDDVTIEDVEGIKCVRVAAVQLMVMGSPFLVAVNPIQVKRCMRDTDPDIINCHFLTSLVSNLLVVMKSFGLMDRPLLFTFHGFEGRYKGVLRMLFTFYWRTFQLFFLHLDGLTSINREYERISFPFARRVVHIPNAPTNPSRVSGAWNQHMNFGINDEDVVVLFVGQLRASKGIPVLLDAAQMILRSHPRTKFIVVGRGPMEPYLRKKVVSHGLEQSFAFTGYLSDSELAGLRTRADLLVLPSFVEGVPRVMLDAMAAGKPVVASNVGSVSDYLKDGVNGLLVKPGDSEELAKALSSLISDRPLRIEMGANGKRMLAGLDWDTVAQQYLEEMNRAIALVRTKRNL